MKKKIKKDFLKKLSGKVNVKKILKTPKKRTPLDF